MCICTGSQPVLSLLVIRHEGLAAGAYGLQECGQTYHSSLLYFIGVRNADGRASSVCSVG